MTQTDSRPSSQRHLEPRQERASFAGANVPFLTARVRIPARPWWARGNKPGNVRKDCHARRGLTDTRPLGDGAFAQKPPRRGLHVAVGEYGRQEVAWHPTLSLEPELYREVRIHEVDVMPPRGRRQQP